MLLDLRRLRVVVYWEIKRSQRWSGRLGPALHRPAMRCSLNMLMDFSAGLLR